MHRLSTQTDLVFKLPFESLIFFFNNKCTLILSSSDMYRIQQFKNMAIKIKILFLPQ